MDTTGSVPTRLMLIVLVKLQCNYKMHSFVVSGRSYDYSLDVIVNYCVIDEPVWVNYSVLQNYDT